MKTTPLLSKGFPKLRICFCFFFLLFALIFQSCGTESGYLQCSIDGNNQVASGPSYPRESPNNKSYAGNVALIFVGAQENPAAYRSQQHSAAFQTYDNFYASTDINPASLAFNSGGQPIPQVTKKPPFDFVSHLNYMGGIELVQKRSGDSGESIALDYLEVPLYGIYQQQLSSGTVFGGLGPYFAYGLGGSTKSSFGGKTTSISSFDSTVGYKRFDAGLGFTAGYRLPNSFYFNLAFELGIANIDRNAFGDKTRNRSISLNVGYPISRLIGHGKK